MTASEADCRHHWQPFYDAPELNTCVFCGAEEPVRVLAGLQPSRVA